MASETHGIPHSKRFNCLLVCSSPLAYNASSHLDPSTCKPKNAFGYQTPPPDLSPPLAFLVFNSFYYDIFKFNYQLIKKSISINTYSYSSFRNGLFIPVTSPLGYMKTRTKLYKPRAYMSSRVRYVLGMSDARTTSIKN